MLCRSGWNYTAELEADWYSILGSTCQELHQASDFILAKGGQAHQPNLDGQHCLSVSSGGLSAASLALKRAENAPAAAAAFQDTIKHFFRHVSNIVKLFQWMDIQGFSMPLKSLMQGDAADCHAQQRHWPFAKV